jgi:hypothetical protein
MLELWRRILIGSAVAVYLVGLGCAGGLLVERVRAGAPSGALGGVVEATGQWLWLASLVDQVTPAAAKGMRR